MTDLGNWVLFSCHFICECSCCKLLSRDRSGHMLQLLNKKTRNSHSERSSLATWPMSMFLFRVAFPEALEGPKTHLCKHRWRKLRCLGNGALSNSSKFLWTPVLQDLASKFWVRSRVRYHPPLVSVNTVMNSLRGLVPKAKSLAICLNLIFFTFPPTTPLSGSHLSLPQDCCQIPFWHHFSPSSLQSLLIRYLNHFPCQLPQSPFFYSSRKYLQVLYIFLLQTLRDADYCLELKWWKGGQPDSDYHMIQAWQSVLQTEMRMALVLGWKKKDGLQPWLGVTSPFPDT